MGRVQSQGKNTWANRYDARVFTDEARENWGGWFEAHEVNRQATMATVLDHVSPGVIENYVIDSLTHYGNGADYIEAIDMIEDVQMAGMLTDARLGAPVSVSGVSRSAPAGLGRFVGDRASSVGPPSGRIASRRVGRAHESRSMRRRRCSWLPWRLR